MLTLLAVALGAALLGRARGGTFESLAATRIAWAPLLLTGLVLQAGFAIWRPAWLSEERALAVVLWSNLFLVTFIVLNRRLPGTMLMAVGLALNVLVIAANQAMPVSATATDVASVARTPERSSLKHELLDDDTRLPYLADIIPLPGLGEVLSAGDLFLIAGTGQLVYSQMLASTQRSRRLTTRASG